MNQHTVNENVWPRPIPLVGDPTSALARAADPTGWSLGDEVADALKKVIASRRDVRRYRPDPIPAELLRAVLEAGHHAPSVGHSQPWRFIVVTDAATRDQAALMADRERLRQAEQLTPDRRARLLDLQLEGIREAPLGVVVACDRRTHAAGVLGRATFTDTDVWSCACAIENMWLTARAAGLGLGWVTLFEPRDLTSLLHLPGSVETLGWLCLGWPDERPPEPGLQRHGWSHRLALDDVIMADRWPSQHEPSAPVSHLAAPGQAAVVAGRDSGDDLLTVPGSLGLLDTAINRVLALNPAPPSSGTLVLVAADHLVNRYGVSAYPDSVTADVVAAAQAGSSLGATAAQQAGLKIEVVKAVAEYPGDIVTADAMSPADVDCLIQHGRDIGRRLGTDGLVCLGEVGVGNTTIAAALAHILLDIPISEAVGLGAGADAATLESKRDVVTKAVARAHVRHGSALGNPRTLLGAVGGPDVALLAGVVLGAAAVATPIVMDGLVTSVAALIAVRLEPGVQSVLIAGQRSRERAHTAVLAGLGLEPLLQLRLRAGEGAGACMAAQLLLTGLRVRQLTARVQDA